MRTPMRIAAAALIALAIAGAASAADARPTAALLCDEERAAIDKKERKNAFDKCASQHAKTEAAEPKRAAPNAAKACKAERAANPAAFEAKYGTNENRSNAYGKCVSQKAKRR